MVAVVLVVRMLVMRRTKALALQFAFPPQLLAAFVRVIVVMLIVRRREVVVVVMMRVVVHRRHIGRCAVTVTNGEDDGGYNDVHLPGTVLRLGRLVWPEHGAKRAGFHHTLIVGVRF